MRASHPAGGARYGGELVKRNGGEARRRITGVILLSTFLIVLTSCATKPEPVEPAAPPAEEVVPKAEPTPQERETLLWEEVRKDIARGAPDSLRAGYRLITESPLIRSPEGVELAYVSFRLLEILYPLTLDFVNPHSPPPGNVYINLFQEVTKGSFPRLEGKSVSFITLLVSTLSCLYTTDPEVSDLCREGLKNLETLVPESVLIPLLRGVIAEKERQGKDAIGYYEKAFSLAADCYPARVGIARIYLGMGKYDKVLEYIDPVVKEYGGNGELYTLQSEAYLGLGDLRNASLFAERALSIIPDSLHLLVLRARILESQGNNEQAKKLIAVAERQNWREPGLYLVKARLLVKDGYMDRAAELLSEGAAAYPDNLPLAEALGRLLLQSGKTAEGKVLLENSISRDPTRTEGLIILIDNAVAESRWEDASALLARALSVEDSVDLWKRGAVIALQIGDNEQALAYGEKLRKAKPDAAEYWIPSIRALVSMKRFPEALAAAKMTSRIQ